MNTYLLATGAILLASAAPAFAQDDAAAAAPAPAAAVPTVDGPSFTGPRAEIFGGWDRVGVRARADDGSGTSKAHASGATAGGLIGYDAAIGNRFTAGLFGSYAISTAKDCYGVDGVASGCAKPGREIEGGARVGAKFGGKALVYLKGAYVNGRIENTFGDGSTYYTTHTNRDGWRAGAGVEYALTPHLYTKVEYDYTRFKSFDGADVGLEDANLRYDRNQVLGGVGIRF